MRSSFEEITSATNNSNQPKDTLMPDIVKAQMKEYLKACMIQEKEISQNKKNNNNSNLFQLDFDFLKQDKSESPSFAKAITKNRNKSNKGNNLYCKEKERRQSLDKKLEDLRFKQAQYELNQLKDKPSINLKSKMITKNRPPIYKRLNEIESQHKEKLQMIQDNIAQDSIRRAQSNRENHALNSTSKAKRKPEQIPFDQWVEMNNEWENCRQNKLEYLKAEIDQFENDDDELIFHPKINMKSREIAEKRYQSKNTIDRLYNCHKSKKANIERKIKELTPSFTPSINKHYPINKDYYSYMEVDQKQIFNEQLK